MFRGWVPGDESDEVPALEGLPDLQGGRHKSL